MDLHSDSDESDSDYDASATEQSSMDVSEESSSSSSDDDDNIMADENGWTAIVDNFADHRPQEIPEFLGATGLNPNIDSENLSVHSVIDLFLTNELIDFLISCTNARATNFFNENPQLENHINSILWIPLDRIEMRKFIGYLFNMALNKKPTVSKYWSTCSEYDSPWFRSHGLSRNRFLTILKFLRFADCRNLVDGDRLCRIRPFVNLVKNTFKNVYIPDRNVCVDESLIKYKGNLNFRQYIKSKRARFGVKVFFLCESEGYMYDFSIYSGRRDYVIPNADNLSSSESIVAYLCSDILNLGYSVYTDNWFSSTRLLLWLLERSTMLTGTIRANRGLPNFIVNAHLQRGQTSFARNVSLLAYKFRDKRDVYFITSQYTATVEEVFRNRGQQEFFYRPSVNSIYSCMARGVDINDQLISPYDCTRKNYYWFKKIGTHFIQRCLINAYHICNKYDINITIEQIISNAVRYYTHDPVVHRHLHEGRHVHVSRIIPQTNTQAHPRRRCRTCTAHGIRRDTHFECATCTDHPPLCLDNCFREYHRY